MILFAVVLLLACHVHGLDDWANYQLIWEDNFDTLNTSKWAWEISAWGGGNSEFELYTNDPSNSYVADGSLYITPTLLENNINPNTGEPFGPNFIHSGLLDLNEMYGGCTNSDNDGCVRGHGNGPVPPVMSARLHSYELFDFTYGRVVFRAKMPTGDWMWPALWLLPEDSVYGTWPASGEIDMMESRGNPDLKENGNYIGTQQMGSTLHWGPAWNANRYYLTHMSKLNTTDTYADDYHTYILDWSTNGIRFIIDDDEILDVPYPLIDQNPTWPGFWQWGEPYCCGYTDPWVNGTIMAPFDQSFYLIMNVAVGGTNGFFPDNAVNREGQYPKPWSNGEGYSNAMTSFWNDVSAWDWTWQPTDQGSLKVDYVKVYKQIQQ